MKKVILALALGLVCATVGLAQQTSADAPATKDDVKRYLEVTHSREMMAKMVDAMAKPMHQMIHEQFLKDKDRLPADFEARMNKMTDDMMKSFPWDDMLDAMVPVYQKHWTKGDIDALVAFYGSPTGQKILRDMPTVMQEAMETMMPLLRKQIDAMNERVQKEVAQMVKDSKT